MIPWGPANAENSFELGCSSRWLPAAAQLGSLGCSCEVQPSALPSSLPSLLPGPSGAIAPATKVSGVKNAPMPHPSYAEHATAARGGGLGCSCAVQLPALRTLLPGPSGAIAPTWNGSLSQIHASLTSLAVNIPQYARSCPAWGAHVQMCSPLLIPSPLPGASAAEAPATEVIVRFTHMYAAPRHAHLTCENRLYPGAPRSKLSPKMRSACGIDHERVQAIFIRVKAHLRRPGLHSRCPFHCHHCPPCHSPRVLSRTLHMSQDPC